MSHLTAFWVPLGYLGGALGCPGLFSQICRKLDAQFRANVSILQCLRIKNSLAELIRGSRLSAQSGARAAVPNPTSRAGGQDDVSLEQTPSNDADWSDGYDNYWGNRFSMPKGKGKGKKGKSKGGYCGFGDKASGEGKYHKGSGKGSGTGYGKGKGFGKLKGTHAFDEAISSSPSTAAATLWFS